MLSISWVKRSGVSQRQFIEVKKKVFHFPATFCHSFILSNPPSLISEMWSLNHRIWRKEDKTLVKGTDLFARCSWKRTEKGTINKTTCTRKNYDTLSRSLNREYTPGHVFGLIWANSYTTQSGVLQDLYQFFSAQIILLREIKMQTLRDSRM